MTIARELPARRGLSWDERALLPRHAGVPWWLAVSLALALTAVGAVADIERIGRLGVVFPACYFLGCLLAVGVVQRRGLFGPMVQPPLVLAITVPSVVLLTGSVPTGGSTTATALAMGTPLINSFPAMAVTTAATLALGAFRLLTQRPPTTPGSPRFVRRAAPAPAAEPVTQPIPRVPPHRRPPPPSGSE
ncbi:MAG TPA: DUF6542 domain-containing protein [Pseudonocardiaceae bacterium]|nr:DUF6542 domain-containing protein [Pseudonocardiaceae bacterium]